MHDESYHTVNILRFWYWEFNVWLLIEHIKRRVTLNLNKKCMRLTYGYFVHILLEVLENFFFQKVYLQYLSTWSFFVSLFTTSQAMPTEKNDIPGYSLPWSRKDFQRNNALSLCDQYGHATEQEPLLRGSWNLHIFVRNYHAHH